MKNNKVKNFDQFNENLNKSNINDDEINKFNNLSYKEKINFLVDSFGMSKIEAMEICDNDTNVDDLPDEIKDYFYNY